MWALLPPLLAIVLALITKEVYSSLFVGILAGALLATGFQPLEALNLIVVDGLSNAVSSMAGNYCFLVLLGFLVALIRRAGGSRAFGAWAQKRIKTRKGAQLTTLLLGACVFVDDYFSCLAVGSVMRPITDRHRISRAKLAFIVDATAAPICMIAPVSSWAAAVSGVATDIGDGMTGMQLFVTSIPYNFYSLLLPVFIIALVCMNVDFGPMRAVERRALAGEGVGDTGNAEAAEARDAADPREPEAAGTVADLMLPILALLVATLLSMLYVGGYFGQTRWTGTENAGDLVGALGSTDAFVALPLGSLVAVCITCAYLGVRRVVSLKDMADCLPQGFAAMVPSILILTLATTLKAVTSALGADVFVHDAMAGASATLYGLLPAVIFVVSVVLAFATGTSWGTFGIMIPIVTAAFSAQNPLMYVGVSACLAGAVCGDHCSPISDTTVMSSAGAHVEHVEHVSTQLPYVLTVAGVSFVTYLFAGFVSSWIACLAVGSALTVAAVALARRLTTECEDEA